jgi:hypothetical protein
VPTAQVRHSALYAESSKTQFDYQGLRVKPAMTLAHLTLWDSLIFKFQFNQGLRVKPAMTLPRCLTRNPLKTQFDDYGIAGMLNLIQRRNAVGFA